MHTYRLSRPSASCSVPLPAAWHRLKSAPMASFCIMRVSMVG